MDKTDIAETLREIAVYLELKGENVFKIRAYENGARALDNLGEDLDQLIADERLGEVPGIGKALVEKIATLRREGKLEFYEQLKASLPVGMVDMLEIPGFGPKKIRKVHEALGVSSIADLKQACEGGKIAELAGFGAKSQENILKGIINREAYGKRHLWWDANAVAAPVLVGLRGLPSVLRAEAAGSLRRGRETVGDLDFLVASSDPAAVMDWFTTLTGVQEVTAKGETKSSVRFASGLQADLRVVPDAEFPFALHHFTGSKDHNVKMRQRALARGFSMSEWGLFPKDASAADRVTVPLKSEEELFAYLGLAYIPPELREGLDEIDLAETGPLPRLVEEADIRGVLHNHTVASDGRNSLQEMAHAAAARGWEYLGIADHSKASVQANGMTVERLLQQVSEIRRGNAEGIFPLKVLAGCEVDILKDGSLDFPVEVLDQLDYVVMSVHGSLSGMDEQVMTDRICRAMATPLRVPRILGHVTGRLLLRREGYKVDFKRLWEVATANKVIIELNANPERLDLDWRWWRQAITAGVYCMINTDAHHVSHFDFIRAGVLTARKAGLTAAQVVNTRPLKDLWT